MAYVITDDQYYTQIANAIRSKNHDATSYLPSQMPTAINNLQIGFDVGMDQNVNEGGDSWTRPNTWPNLDNVDVSTLDGVYLTYDLSKTPGYGWIGVYVTNKTSGTTYTIERGHLVGNEFVADYSTTANTGTYFRQSLDTANGTIQLWRVSSTSQITRFCFIGNDATNANCYYTFEQPCVERKGRLPYITNISSYTSTRYNATDGYYGTAWMEKDNTIPGESSVLTSMAGMYCHCCSLQSVNLNWSTAAWKPTSLASLFQNCYLLRTIDVSSWNTTIWPVTNIGSTFYNCSSVKSLNLSTWDTSNWVVTSGGSTFYYCLSLKYLNCTWNTAKWKITSLASMFSCCESLEEIIGISSWNTAGFACTALNALFNSCKSLKSIDLSSWNTAAMRVTNISNMFAYCYSLIDVKMNTWSTSAWNVTNMTNMFNGCYSLKRLDLSNWVTTSWTVATMDNFLYDCRSLRTLNLPWTTSNWVVNTLASSFRNLWGLKVLNLSTWTTANWAVKSLANTFDSCYSVETIQGISSWNTSNWAVTTCVNLFSNCYSLKTLDLSGWDTENWAVTTVGSMFNGCEALTNVSWIGDWDTSNWPLTTMSYMFARCLGLTTVDLSDWDTTNFAVTTVQYIFQTSYKLESFYFPSGFTSSTYNVTSNSYVPTYSTTLYKLRDLNGVPDQRNVNWSTMYSLSHDSLVSIINKLQTVSNKTLTLGQGHKLKLSAAEMAVATQKGWTIA